MQRIFSIFLLSALYIFFEHANAKEIKLVTGNDYAPFTDYSSFEGGVANQIITKSLKHVGISVEIERRPWSRGYQDTLNDRYLGAFPYLKTDEREKDFYYSSPLYSVQQFYFHRKGFHIDLSKKQTLCSPLGWTINNSLKSKTHNSKAKIETPIDMYACVRMVLAGRADFFVANKYIVQNMKISPLLKWRLDKTPVNGGMIDEFLIIRKQSIYSVDFLNNFEIGFEKLKESGEYYRLLQSIE